MQKYKIAFFLGQLSGGGAQRVIANLSSQYAKNNYDTTVITLFKTEDEYPLHEDVKRIVIDGENTKVAGLSGTIKRNRILRKICKKEKFDVVVSFMAGANYHAIIATIGLPCKTIISVRNDPKKEYPGRVHAFLARKLLPNANGCVFQTNDAKVYFAEKLQKKSAIIYNPVNPRFYEVNYNPTENRIVTCGRLEKQKNHVMLIEAFHKIREKNPTATVHIYGSGKYRSVLQQKIEELGLRQAVFIEGSTSDVPSVLEKGKIFVLSSDVEGMPNALMEAMAAGLPCVATDCPCGGPAMLLEEGKNGILVPVNDAEALAVALEKLLADPALIKHYSQSAKHAAGKFTQEKIFEEWNKYVLRILKGA